MPYPRPFAFRCPTQVIFGAGEHNRIKEVLPPRCRHVVLVQGASGSACAPVLACLQIAGLEITHIPCAGEPTVLQVNTVLGTLSGTSADVVIACGGGSVLDTAKVIRFALAHGLGTYDDFANLTPQQLDTACALPLIALPTTAGTGAEVTANAVIGVPEQAAKVSLRGRAFVPDIAIIDPDLMRNAPDNVVLHSGLDAVTQVFESYTSNAATPFSDALTRSTKALGLPALRAILEDHHQAAWHDLAWVAHASGLALANSGLGAAHGLASVIGGQYGAPHGALCGRLLIPVLRQNLARSETASDTHARIMSCIGDIADAFAPTQPDDPMSGFAAWMEGKGLPRLADWSVTADELPDLAKRGGAASSSQKNAVTLTQDDYLEILRAAL